jgi:hypothetical protein
MCLCIVVLAMYWCLIEMKEEIAFCKSRLSGSLGNQEVGNTKPNVY